MPADPATHTTMQDNDQKPKELRDAPVSEPGVVRATAAQALVVPRAGSHEEPEAADLAIADGGQA